MAKFNAKRHYSGIHLEARRKLAIQCEPASKLAGKTLRQASGRPPLMISTTAASSKSVGQEAQPAVNIQRRGSRSTMSSFRGLAIRPGWLGCERFNCKRAFHHQRGCSFITIKRSRLQAGSRFRISYNIQIGFPRQQVGKKADLRNLSVFWLCWTASRAIHLRNAAIRKKQQQALTYLACSF